MRIFFPRSTLLYSSQVQWRRSSECFQTHQPIWSLYLHQWFTTF